MLAPEIERVRKQIDQILNQMICCDDYGRTISKTDQILAIKGLGVKADKQGMPPVEFTTTTMNTDDASKIIKAFRQSYKDAGFVRLVPKEG